MEGNLLGFDLTVLDLHLITSEYDRNILTHACEITVPVWHIFVSNTGCHIEHDNGALALDVVSVAKPAKFFLAGGVPYVELDWPSVGVEEEWVDFNSEGGYILLFEFTGEMAFHESCFAYPAITYKD